MRFTSTQSVRDVHRFWAERAAENGWTPQRRLASGLIASWTQQMPPGQGQFLLNLLDHFSLRDTDLTEKGISRSYSVTGSVLSKSLPPQS